MYIYFIYTYSLLFSLVIGANLLTLHANYCADSFILFHCCLLSRWYDLGRWSMGQWSRSPPAGITFYSLGLQSWQSWLVFLVRYMKPCSIILLWQNHSVYCFVLINDYLHLSRMTYFIYSMFPGLMSSWIGLYKQHCSLPWLADSITLVTYMRKSHFDRSKIFLEICQFDNI